MRYTVPNNMAKILDGRIVNEKIAKQLRTEISTLRTPPKLVIIQVGDLPESNAYIARKKTFGEKIGAVVDHQKFPNDISQNKLITHISSLNTDSTVTGIIVQMPLPKHLNKDEIIETIDPQKDVDGLTSKNLKLLWESPSLRHPGVATTTIGSQDSISAGRLARLKSSQWRSSDISGPAELAADIAEFTLNKRNRSFAVAQDDKSEGLQNDHESQGFTPATTKGIITLLDYYKIPIAGKHVVVVGRSFLVGKPTMLAFLNRDATVTVAHSKTRNLKQVTRNADILVVAAGTPKLIGKEHVAKGQVVIDVGINVIETRNKKQETRNFKPEVEPISRRLVGDVDFEAVKNLVGAISPVPGGIGPMTVASLFQNLLLAYQNKPRML